MSEMTVEERAKAIFEAFTKRHGIAIPWDRTDAETRDSWIKMIERCDEIGRDINYDD